MELNKREAIFAAVFNGFLSHQDQFNDANPGTAIRACWVLADKIIYHADRIESPQKIANRWINKNLVIVDTETTGLGFKDEIVEISIIDCGGNILLDTLIKPSTVIPEEATAIHGITNDMVKDAPRWEDILPGVIDIISHGWVAYNASFDARMLRQSGGDYVQHEDIISPECIMQLYAEYNGQWDARRKRYKWKRLSEAAVMLKVEPGEGTPHRSLFDCQLTLGIIRAIAGGAM